MSARRDVSSPELVREWRDIIGVVPGAREVNFRSERVRGGQPIDIQLQGSDFEEMRLVADALKTQLNTYPGVFDAFHTFEGGKEEVKLTLRPEAEILGLTLEDLARQVRQAFYGFEVQRIQRGRDEVRVFVRYPESERRSLDSLSSMRIRTPTGTEVPFGEVASARFGRGFSTIQRIDRLRAVNVRADVNKEAADVEAIKRDLDAVMPQILADHPQVSYVLEGEAREQQESFASVGIGILFVLFVIYALLAIPFRSYIQPLIVMSIIPFGVAGAMLGHIVMDMSLSIMSIMGMLALCGVVVNDSLVLVDYVNRRRREGMPLNEAVRTAGLARLRPVLLTSVTTFAGLTPLLVGEIHPGPVDDPDGRVAGVRHPVRDVYHAAFDTDQLPHTRGPEGAGSAGSKHVSTAGTRSGIKKRRTPRDPAHLRRRSATSAGRRSGSERPPRSA